MLHCRCLTRFWVWLNISILNIPGVRIAQDSEYISGSECARFLNIPKFWICQDFSGSRICLNTCWICRQCLIKFEYVWTFLNVPIYAWICLNLPEQFCISPFPCLFYNPFSTLTPGYLFERLQETIGYSLKEHEVIFLKRQKLIFAIAAGIISIISCFRLNILQVRFKLAVTFWCQGIGGQVG